MKDPTYVRKDINNNPAWKLAFIMSELVNDGAPIGWGNYIILAEGIIAHYDMKERKP